MPKMCSTKNSMQYMNMLSLVGEFQLSLFTNQSTVWVFLALWGINRNKLLKSIAWINCLNAFHWQSNCMIYEEYCSPPTLSMPAVSTLYLSTLSATSIGSNRFAQPTCHTVPPKAQRTLRSISEVCECVCVSVFECILCMCVCFKPSRVGETATALR